MTESRLVCPTPDKFILDNFADSRHRSGSVNEDTRQPLTMVCMGCGCDLIGVLGYDQWVRKEFIIVEEEDLW